MTMRHGFTLVEISIVIIIIGLIIGGVITGRDLIQAAEVRSQMAQIEKYQAALNTFRNKYNRKLPGDINDPDATNFGFAPRGTEQGQGDNNGLIEGYDSFVPVSSATIFAAGETLLFWMDLSTAQLINESFNSGDFSAPIPMPVTGSDIARYLPPAKFGKGTYVYTESTKFIISGITSITDGGTPHGMLIDPRTIPVAQAFSFDQKTDDGLPTTGRVRALTDNFTVPPYSFTTPATTTTCYDNGGVLNASYSYSMSINSGSSPTCGLSIPF